MKRKFEITDASTGAAFQVRVVMRSGKTEIAGMQQDESVLKVRLTAGPDHEAVKKQLIELLAQTLEVSTTQIELVTGGEAKDKFIVIVDQLNPNTLADKLAAFVRDED
jgi:uncharacterized protein YggU (UPF0235/DUF167 family)